MKIILIGFMGSGKSSVGKALSKKLKMKFLDIDNEVERIEGCSITDLFEKHGQEYFRSLENDLLKKILKEKNIIVSTGGGIIARKENLELLKRENKVIFLDANVETIIKNVSKEISKRPLLKDSKNLYIEVDNLLYKRYEKYKQIADFTIDVNEKNIEEVVSQILVYIG